MLAGYRKPAHVDIFLGTRLVLPVALGCLSAILFSTNLFLFLMTLVVGFFIPDFWLNLAVKKRRERIRLSLPDGLDLLTICIEAGLGLDQGIVRVGQELRVSHPELSEELLQINLEQRAGATENCRLAIVCGPRRYGECSVISWPCWSKPTASEPPSPSRWEISPTHCGLSAGKKPRNWRRRRPSNSYRRWYFSFSRVSGLLLSFLQHISILESLKHLAD